MSLLKTINQGKQKLPPRLFIYGTEGIGKSTVAADANKTIFLPTEAGLGEIDCASFPIAKSYDEVVGNIKALVAEKHDYKTACIDTTDWLEMLVWDKLCKDWGVDNIEQVDGGYAKGYKHALTPWRHLLDGLDILRNECGMTVILLAHAKIEKFEDPEYPAYDRYTPRMHKYAAGLISEWADATLFATRKIITKSEDAGFNKTRTTAAGLGHGGGERILRCVGSPACIAKNRYNLPDELPLSWATLDHAIKEGRKCSTTTKTTAK